MTLTPGQQALQEAAQDRVSVAPKARSGRENKDEPARCVNTSPALTSKSERDSEMEAGVDIIAPSRPADRQAHQSDLRHLQLLLAESIRKRDALVSLIDRHWYVPGDGDYCQACNLPERNGRHAPRVA